MWPLLFAAGMGLQALSTYKESEAEAQQYEYKEAEARYRAKVAEADAKAMQQRTTFEQQRQIVEAAGEMGAMRVAQATSGAQTDVGTPVLVRAQQWSEFELENFLIGLEGRTAKSKFLQEKAFENIQAGIYHRTGRNVKKAGKLNMFAGILQGFGQGYGMGIFGKGGGGNTYG